MECPPEFFGFDARPEGPYDLRMVADKVVDTRRPVVADDDNRTFDSLIAKDGQELFRDKEAARSQIQ